MASRWKNRSRSSAYEQQLQQQRLLELECLLTQKDDAIAGLEKKLAEQLQVAKKLRRDREELRNKNASLIGKLAEVSRKQSSSVSFFSTTPPTPPR